MTNSTDDATCTCPIKTLCTRDTRGACFDKAPVHHRQVLCIDGAYYLVGVKRELTGIESLDARRDEEPGLYLLARYESGDVDSPYNGKLMHSALYDAHQCHSFAKDGDRIETPHGVFVVHGVHVETWNFETKAEAKARRARLRRAARRFRR